MSADLRGTVERRYRGLLPSFLMSAMGRKPMIPRRGPVRLSPGCALNEVHEVSRCLTIRLGLEHDIEIRRRSQSM